MPHEIMIPLAMLATYLVRLFMPKIDKRLLPVISVVLAVLGKIATMDGATPVESIASDGIAEGLAASGMWSLGGKRMEGMIRAKIGK